MAVRQFASGRNQDPGMNAARDWLDRLNAEEEPREQLASAQMAEADDDRELVRAMHGPAHRAETQEAVRAGERSSLTTPPCQRPHDRMRTATKGRGLSATAYVPGGATDPAPAQPASGKHCNSALHRRYGPTGYSGRYPLRNSNYVPPSRY